MRHNYVLPKDFSSVHACGRRIRSSLSASCPLPCTPAAKSTRGAALLGSTAAGLPAAGTACCGPASQSVAPASGGGGVITSDWPVGRGALLWLFHIARGRSDCQSAACRASMRSCTVTTTICSQRQRVHVDMRMPRARSLCRTRLWSLHACMYYPVVAAEARLPAGQQAPNVD